jgi:hypothetical protein
MIIVHRINVLVSNLVCNCLLTLIILIHSIIDESDVCSSHGDCLSVDTCQCINGYFGSRCDLYSCFGFNHSDPLACSSHGSCISPNNCNCTDGYSVSADCKKQISCFDIDFNSTTVCNSHGHCLSDNVCNCSLGYAGMECELPVCYGKNSSDPSVCSGHGTCISVDQCSCHTQLYEGQMCETQVVSYMNLTYSIEYEPCSNVTISMTISYLRQITNATTVQWSIVNDEQLQVYLTSINQSSLVIPYNYLQPGRQYHIQVTATLDNLEKLNSSATFYIKDYVPTISFNKPNGFMIHRKESTQISAALSVPWCINPSASYYWTVNSTSIVSYSSNLIIPAFTFQIEGEYSISLTVTERSMTILRNITIQVVVSPFSASIVSGNQLIELNENYTIDASTTIDTEYPNTTLVYSWECINQANNQKCSNFTNSDRSVQSFYGTESGQFLVTVYVTSILGRTSNTSITIQVHSKSNPVPMVTISSSLTSITGSSQKIGLVAVFASDIDTSNIQIMWSVTLSNNSANILDQLDSSKILTVKGTRSLVLQENSLIPGGSYTFTVSAKYRNQTDSASVSTTMSNIPSRGTFEIVPASGYSMTTLFNLTVQNFKDTNGNGQLQYAFQYWDTTLNTYRLLRAFDTSSQIQSQLFTTITTNTTIRCIVRNTYGDELTAEYTVLLQVTPQNQIDLISYMETKKQQLEQSQVLTPDLGFALIAVATMSTSMNTSSSTLDSLLDLISTSNNYPGDTSLINQFQEQISTALQIVTGSSQDLSKQRKEKILSLVGQILTKSDTQYQSSVASSAINIISNVNYEEKSSYNNALKDLSQYGLASLLPGETPLVLSSSSISITLQKNFASNIADTVIQSNTSSVSVPKIPILENSDPDTIFSLEYMTFTDLENQNLWADNIANISTQVISFKVLDQNGTKVPIITAQDDPLVIVLSNMNSTSSSPVCKYLESPEDTEWETYGCYLFQVTDSQVICHCNHTTSFAAFIEYTAADVANISPIKKAVYIVTIIFSGLYIVLITVLLSFLFIQRNKQPIRSRLFAPFVCLTAILIEAVLSGIVRNALLLAQTNYKAIDSIGKVILIVCNPLAIVSLYIFMWQSLRYIVLRRVYELMASTKTGTLFKFGKILTSKTIFIVSASIIYLLSLAYYLAFSAVAISQFRHLDEVRSTYLTLVSAISYSSTMIVLSIVIILFICWDSIIIPFQTMKRNKRIQQQQQQQQQVELDATKPSTVDGDKKKKMNVPLLQHFVHEDPLFFRLDSVFLVTSIFVGFVSFGIGIGNRYLVKREDSPVMVVWLVFDLLYMFLRIVTFGGCLSAMRLLSIYRKNDAFKELGETVTIDLSEDALTAVLSILRNKTGFLLVKEYCVKEFSLENLYVIY